MEIQLLKVMFGVFSAPQVIKYVYISSQNYMFLLFVQYAIHKEGFKDVINLSPGNPGAFFPVVLHFGKTSVF